MRFGRAFAVGALIAVVASLCYVADLGGDLLQLRPGLHAEVPGAHARKARANGESEEAIAAKKAEMERFAKLYQNPAINAAITFLEPLPVALVVSLVSAGVLSRRRKAGAGQAGTLSSPAVHS